MVSNVGLNPYMIPYLASANATGISFRKTSSQLSDFNLYSPPALIQAYAQSRVASLQQSGQVPQTVSSVWNDFQSLYNMAKPFTANDTTSAFSQKTVTSSDSTAVTAAATGGAVPGSYTVGVSQLATAQQNSGSALQSNGTNLSGGVTTSTTYSLKLTTGAGTQQTYYVNVKAGDQDQKVLQKMADAINTANSTGTAAVKAQVVNTVAGGLQYSKLEITAANTGTNNAFILSDTTGNLAAASGVASAQGGQVAAQNATYTVNGVSSTSQSNTVAIQNTNVTMTLAKVTQQNATLTVGQDAAGITKQMASFVQQYNTTVNALQNSGLNTAPKLTSRLTQSIAAHANDLQNIGLTLTNNDTLVFDQSTFQQALTSYPTKVKSLLTGFGNIATNVQSVAQSVTALPPSWLANTQNPYPGTDSSLSTSAQFQQYLASALFGTLYGSSGSLLDIAA